MQRWFPPSWQDFTENKIVGEYRSYLNFDFSQWNFLPLANSYLKSSSISFIQHFKCRALDIQKNPSFLFIFGLVTQITLLPHLSFLVVQGYGRLEFLEGNLVTFHELGQVSTLLIVWCDLPAFLLQEFSLWLPWGCALSPDGVYLTQPVCCAIENQFKRRHHSSGSPGVWLNCLQKKYHVFSANYWFICLLSKLISI